MGKRMNHDDILKVFDTDGILSRSFSGYEYREEQVQMALNVTDAINQGCVAAIEAGTGIGKSFAYLVPHLLNCLENPDKRVVIATSTINLQRQLFDKDVPSVFDCLGKKVTVSVLFGRSNYLCKRRAKERIAQQPLLAEDPHTDEGKLAWCLRNDFPGSRTDLPFNFSDPSLWADVCSDFETCAGFKCPFAQDCFYQKAKHQAVESRIIITNHHLLFTDASMRDEGFVEYDEDCLLPAFSSLVVDEAHNMERNATDLFSSVYSGHSVRRLIYKFNQRRFSGKSAFESLIPFSEKKDVVDVIPDILKLLGERTVTLDSYLQLFFNELKGRTSYLVKAEEKSLPRLKEFFPVAVQVQETLFRAAARLREFSESLQAKDTPVGRIEEFDVFQKNFEDFGNILKSFCAFTDDNWVHFLERETRRNEQIFNVCLAPLSVAEILNKTLFSRIESIVCCSATMDLNDDFAFWMRRVGLNLCQKPMIKAIYASAFDYQHNLLLLTPADSPRYSKDNMEAFLIYVKAMIRDAILSSGGGCLALFTNQSLMEDIHHELAPQLQVHGINTFLQSKKSDRAKLLVDFKADEDSCLFATNSFWEGVDAPGNTLRMVIIVKLPFTAPDEPVFQARSERIEKDGGSSFFELSVPDATMRLKQGFGRLIRSATDKGIVLILDSRIVTKNYGLAMIRSLPDSYHPDTLSEGVCNKIEEFLY
jgi:ATP-dependent DNA helicase DinG